MYQALTNPKWRQGVAVAAQLRREGHERKLAQKSMYKIGTKHIQIYKEIQETCEKKDLKTGAN